jgi:O-antigen/teichoic acid export membrane protein
VSQGFSELVSFGLLSVNMVLAPTVADLYSKREIQRLQNIVTKSARASFLFTLPVALLFIFYGSGMISFLYGSQFIPAALPLSILCVAQVVNGGMGSVALLLNMTGFEKDTAAGTTIAAISNVFFNLLLIPSMGIVGASIATGMSIIIWNVILVKLLFKRTGIYSPVFGKYIKV